jgi:hypothetical protein
MIAHVVLFKRKPGVEADDPRISQAHLPVLARWNELASLAFADFRA